MDQTISIEQAEKIISGARSLLNIQLKKEFRSYTEDDKIEISNIIDSLRGPVELLAMSINRISNQDLAMPGIKSRPVDRSWLYKYVELVKPSIDHIQAIREKYKAAEIVDAVIDRKERVWVFDISEEAHAFERILAEHNWTLAFPRGLYRAGSELPSIMDGDEIILTDRSGSTRRIYEYGKENEIPQNTMISFVDHRTGAQATFNTRLLKLFKPHPTVPIVGFWIIGTLVDQLIVNNCLWSRSYQSGQDHIKEMLLTAPTTEHVDSSVLTDELLDELSQCFSDVYEKIATITNGGKWHTYETERAGADITIIRGPDFRIIEWERVHGAEFRNANRKNK